MSKLVDERARAGSSSLGGARAPAWWPRLADRPGLARLCDIYAAKLMEAGNGTHAGTSDDGFDWAMRWAYREALIEAEAEGGPEPLNPFADGREAFVASLGGPRWPSSEVSRYVAELWSARADLPAAFPAVSRPRRRRSPRVGGEQAALGRDAGCAPDRPLSS
jgi:hypothetical protein